MTAGRPSIFADRYEIVSARSPTAAWPTCTSPDDQVLDRPVAVKVALPRVRPRPSVRRAVPARGADRRGAEPPQHRRRLRLGPGARHVLHRHGVRRRSVAARHHPAPRARSPRARPRTSAPRSPTALSFAHAQRRRAPRHQARQRADHPDRPGEGHRLRDRAAPATREGLTQTGSVMGTATYFSPEQAQGFAVDGRTDVYSLGVVLYEMVTGVAPFTGDTPVAVAKKHVREAPVAAVRSVTPTSRPTSSAIIVAALAKDPHDRYQSADDVRDDLIRFRRGRPVVGAAITARSSRSPTPPRRWRATAAAAPIPLGAPSPPPPSAATGRRSSRRSSLLSRRIAGVGVILARHPARATSRDAVGTIVGADGRRSDGGRGQAPRSRAQNLHERHGRCAGRTTSSPRDGW